MPRHTLLIILLFFTQISISQTKYVDAIFKKTTKKTLRYAIKNKDTLKLDIYQPTKDKSKKRLLFVILHGGGFVTGKRNDSSLVNLANNVARKGYVVASIDYRLLKKPFGCNLPVNEEIKIYSNASEDLLNALLYLTKYKRKLKIDPNRIILFGISAGAETLLNITYSRDMVIKNLEKYETIKPAAVISISGAVLNTDSMTNAIPGVFYHGEKDPIVPYGRAALHSCKPTDKGYLEIDGSKKIIEKLEEFDANYIFYTYKNGGHNIQNLPNDDFRKAFEFVKKVVIDNEKFQFKSTK